MTASFWRILSTIGFRLGLVCSPSLAVQFKCRCRRCGRKQRAALVALQALYQDGEPSPGLSDEMVVRIRTYESQRNRRDLLLARIRDFGASPGDDTKLDRLNAWIAGETACLAEIAKAIRGNS